MVILGNQDLQHVFTPGGTTSLARAFGASGLES